MDARVEDGAPANALPPSMPLYTPVQSIRLDKSRRKRICDPVAPPPDSIPIYIFSLEESI